MCPAFGSLRVGLRMRRTATVLCGSACCVYGLTFTSHFYGAKRTVGYVPFNSETLVTGKLFEDMRDAVHQLADPEKYDAVVVTNLCVPTASGVPLAAAERDQRRAHHRHRRAGLRRADPCRGQGRAGRRDAAYARNEAEQGPWRPRQGAATGCRRSRCSARCSRPIRSASA
jgi:chlorophyllide a reductase subunit Y